MRPNPIIQRELIGALRSRWAIAMQVTPALLFAAVVLVRWPTDAQVDVAGLRSQQVFRLLGYGFLAVLVLLVPAYPATAIVREKKQGTLVLLLNTPLSRWSIYQGKLLGALGYVWLPLVMSLPAAAACYAMGGLSLPRDLAPLYALLALATLQYATLALWVSSLAASSDSALRATYLLVLVLTVVVLGPQLFLQGRDAGILLTAAQWLQSLSPIPAVMELLGQADAGGQGISSRAGAPARYALLACATIVAAALHTCARLRQTMFDRPRPAGVMTDDRGTGQRVLRRLFFLIDPQRRTTGTGRWTNPVFIKEFRSRRFGRGPWMLRLIAGCALCSLLLTYAATSGTVAWGVETIGGIMVLLQIALIIVLTPSLASGLISSEREGGGWPLLRMTALSPGRILRGKLASVAWTMALILLATLPGYLVMIVIQPALKQQVLAVLLCLVFTAAFAVASSTLLSSLLRRTAAATVASYALLVALFGGTLLVWLGRDAPFGHKLVERVLRINPIAAALSMMDVSGFGQYDLVPANWWIVGGASVACLVGLALRVRRLMQPE